MNQHEIETLAQVGAALCTDADQVRQLIGDHSCDFYYGDPCSNTRKYRGKVQLEHRLCYQWDEAWEKHFEEYGLYDYDAWQQMMMDKEKDFDDICPYEIEFDSYQGGRKIERFAGYEPEHLLDPEQEDDVLDFLRALHVVIKRCESIFSRQSIEDELTYQVLWQRGEWEAERRAERKKQ